MGIIVKCDNCGKNITKKIHFSISPPMCKEEAILMPHPTGELDKHRYYCNENCFWVDHNIEVIRHD